MALISAYFAGGIFDKNPDLNTEMLNFAVQQASDKILDGSGIELKAITETVEYGNEINGAEKVCELMKVRVLNRLLHS